MAHEPLPDIYFNARTAQMGTVTLEPDFDAVMFKPVAGGNVSQFSPEEAEKLILNHDRCEDAFTAGVGGGSLPPVDAHVDWTARLAALRATMAVTVPVGLAAGPKGVSYLDAHTGLVGPVFLDAGKRRIRFAPDGAKADDPNFAFTVQEASERLRRVNADPLIPTEPMNADYWNALLDAQEVPVPVQPPAWLPEGWTASKRQRAYFGPNADEVYQSERDGWACATGTLRDNDADLDRDLQALVFALHDPGRVVAVSDLAVEIAGLQDRAKAFLLADDVLNASPRQTGAHDAAMWILGYGGKVPDPRTTMRGEIARLSGEVERLKTEVQAAHIKTDGPSRLTPPEIANLRAMWGDPDGGQIRAVRWYRERFTPSCGLAEALRDVRVILGVPTVSLEERVTAIQEVDRLRAMEAAMAKMGGQDPMSWERRAYLRAVVANEIAHNKGQPAWCGWLLDALDAADKLVALEAALLAVNELAPPSDWLRDLKACQTIPELDALRERAIAENLRRIQAEHDSEIPFG